ncbi:MAG: hypothetical protein GY853_14205 [PVC group bacterium]|nr:hypothetical protein [PVC group bacterium]
MGLVLEENYSGNTLKDYISWFRNVWERRPENITKTKGQLIEEFKKLTMEEFLEYYEATC